MYKRIILSPTLPLYLFRTARRELTDEALSGIFCESIYKSRF